MIKAGLKSDTCEENRPEDHIRIDIHLLGYIFRILNGAKDNTSNIGTGNIRNTKEYFRYISKNKAERQT